MKRVTFSLSDDTREQVTGVALRAAGGNESLVAEIALRQLFQRPSDEVDRLMARAHLDRRARTRGGWARAFWYVLCDLMGRPLYDPERTHGPRNFGDFQVVLLLSHMDRPDDEDDPFTPYIAPVPATLESPRPWQRDFQRSDSPVTAAEVIAEKLREFGVQALVRKEVNA
jgi:hypothetical protein